ncbi:MAG: CRTAC1 family protein, partial [Bacteroidota bacterium]
MEKHSLFSWISGILFLLLLGACQSETATTPNATTPPQEPLDGNQRMVRLLDSLARAANAQECYNLNSLRAEAIKVNIRNENDSNRKLNMILEYASELLNAGKTQEAIKEILNVINLIGGLDLQMNAQSKKVFDLLAIAYLRQGEQDNCITNHNAASCILPLQAQAIHTIKTGSQKAIEIYNRILRQFPDDHQSRWLLNLAHMTLGQYPDQVPPSWRIPEATFKNQKAGLKVFKDVAIGLDVAVSGLSGGCCIEDFNQDGFLDIFATSYGFTDQARLFFSTGDGGYQDVTEQSGLKGQVGGLNTIHADYNNDGFQDILILRGGWFGKGGKLPNSLLKNNGDGTFSDVTIEAGLLSFHPTQTAAWADVNLDGWLDLYIGNESQAGNLHPCELYMNRGNGTFVEMARQLQVNYTAFVKGVRWGDVNNDGLPDLYISSLGNKNKLYINRGGTNAADWRFEDVSAKAKVEEPIFSFPTWFFDYDNDGFEDLFVAGYDLQRLKNVAFDISAEYLGLKPQGDLPKLYRNNGDETFSDQTAIVQLDKIMYAMGSNYGDLDNDGFLDFYIGTGEPDLRSVVPNRMFKNQNGKSFTEVSMSAGFAHIQKGHGVGFGDMDNDGDQDIYCVVGGAYEGDISQNVLFENPNPSNAWVTLQLEGRGSNRNAFGAKIKLTLVGGRTIYRSVGTGGSFGSSSIQQEIGLGKAKGIQSIEVFWPRADRTPSVYQNVSMNKIVKLIEG